MNQEMFLLIAPLVILELVLKLVCFRDWIGRTVMNGLPKPVWLVIILFINLFGPIAYLVYGRKTYGND